MSSERDGKRERDSVIALLQNVFLFVLIIRENIQHILYTTLLYIEEHRRSVCVFVVV